MKGHMKSKKVEFVINDELLEQLDEAAAKSFTTRSDYVRECIVLRLRKEEIVKQEKDEFYEKLKQYEQEVWQLNY